MDSPQKILAKELNKLFKYKLTQIIKSKEEFIENNVIRVLKEKEGRVNLNNMNMNHKYDEFKSTQEGLFACRDGSFWGHHGGYEIKRYIPFKTTEEAQNLLDKALNILYNPRRYRNPRKRTTSGI